MKKRDQIEVMSTRVWARCPNHPTGGIFPVSDPKESASVLTTVLIHEQRYSRFFLDDEDSPLHDYTADIPSLAYEYIQD